MEQEYCFQAGILTQQASAPMKRPGMAVETPMIEWPMTLAGLPLHQAPQPHFAHQVFPHFLLPPAMT
jgi:hypothetical protein